MKPFRFIKLHERNRCGETLVNVEQIVFIRDCRTDPAVKNLRDFRWTRIETTKCSIEVLETEEEIVNKIALLQ